METRPYNNFNAGYLVGEGLCALPFYQINKEPAAH